MKILLAGCGDIGQRVADRFADEHQCFGLRRNPEHLPVFINPLKADLTNSEDLGGIFSQDFEVSFFRDRVQLAFKTQVRVAMYVGPTHKNIFDDFAV